MKIIKCYVYPVLTYGCESWTVTQEMEEKINVVEMWMLRRIRRILWTEHVCNDGVRRRANYGKVIMKSIRKRQLSFVGHVMRKEGLENLAITVKLQGTKGRGR